MKCPECDGDGVIYTTEDMDCPECNGTGEVEGEDDDEGSDDDSLDCPRCGGSGGGPEHWQCPDCLGSGRNQALARERREDYEADQRDVKEDR